jgi:hypothetical protein
LIIGVGQLLCYTEVTGHSASGYVTLKETFTGTSAQIERVMAGYESCLPRGKRAYWVIKNVKMVTYAVYYRLRKITG